MKIIVQKFGGTSVRDDEWAQACASPYKKIVSCWL